MEPSLPTAETIRFRSNKKRKGYRQRAATTAAAAGAADNDDDASSSTATGAVPIAPRAASPRDADLTAGAIDGEDADIAEEDGGDGVNDDEDGEEESAVAAALRLRNARRTGRFRGVGFKSDSKLGENTEQALALRDAGGSNNGAEGAVVGGIENRFMHQTGLLTILDDRHMDEYIESRLASRNAPPGTLDLSTSSKDEDEAATTSTTTKWTPTALASAPGGGGGGRGKASARNPLTDQPARHGKLLEVAIPEEIYTRDAQNKRRRVEKPAKPPRRGRNRRNSDDIMRDNLVEQFLHENKLDVYDVTTPPQASTSTAPGDDPSADDRLAAQFRQQYFNEQAMRRRNKKRPAQGQQQRQQSSSDVLKGPKLGGSRNQRAAVRDILLQQQENKKKQ